MKSRTLKNRIFGFFTFAVFYLAGKTIYAQTQVEKMGENQNMKQGMESCCMIGNMHGPGTIIIGILGISLVIALIAALVALTVFLVRHSRPKT